MHEILNKGKQQGNNVVFTFSDGAKHNTDAATLSVMFNLLFKQDPVDDQPQSQICQVELIKWRSTSHQRQPAKHSSEMRDSIDYPQTKPTNSGCGPPPGCTDRENRFASLNRAAEATISTRSMGPDLTTFEASWVHPISGLEQVLARRKS